MLKLMILKITTFYFLLFTFSCTRPINYTIPADDQRRVKIGLENFIENHAYRYKGKRTAVITNHSGVDFKLRRNIDLFRRKGLKITSIFSPEHGLYGFFEDIDKKPYTYDKKLKLRVYNLYKTDDKLLKKLLRRNQCVIFDIQDMGMRCYTYISNLKTVIDALQGADRTELIVLDRPNPIIPLKIDGLMLNPKFKSKYISSFPAPFIYGMTIGEAALYYSNEFAPDIRLEVYKMEGYERDLWFNSTKLPWIPPSPNLPSYKSAIIYTSVVLLEGINFSIGRGTANPFEYIGAPWVDPYKFTSGLKKLKLRGVSFRPIYFEPKYSNYKDEICGGTQIFFNGRDFNPTEINYKIIKYIYENYKEMQWRTYHNRYHIDYLAGSDKFRKDIIAGKDWSELEEEMEKQIDDYKDKMNDYKLY